MNLKQLIDLIDFFRKEHNITDETEITFVAFGEDDFHMELYEMALDEDNVLVCEMIPTEDMEAITDDEIDVEVSEPETTKVYTTKETEVAVDKSQW